MASLRLHRVLLLLTLGMFLFGEVSLAGGSVSITGVVRIVRKGDAVVKITVGVYSVKLDQNARSVAAYDGRKVIAQGTFQKVAGVTMLAVTSVRAAP